MNAPKSWLFPSLAVLFLAACSTNNPSTTGQNGSGGTGDSASNGTGATGVSNGGSNNGTNTGAPPPQDPIGKTCSKTGNPDYAPCSTSVDCQCPLLCALDYTLGADDGGGSICTYPCTQDSECPDIFTHCDDHGLCTTNICEADGGSDNVPFFGACDSSGTDDGTCEPTADTSHVGNIIGVCFQAGTAVPGDNCDPNQVPFDHKDSEGNTKRPPGKTLCPVGYECNGQTSKCQQLCDPIFFADSDNDGGGCLDDLTCQAIGKDTKFGGACQATGDGGCTIGQGSGELGDCTITANCACPLSCFADFSSEIHSCEKVCHDTATDCDVPFTNCQKDPLAPQLKYCNYNFCAQNFFGEVYKPDSGSNGFGGGCDYLGSDDGSCQLEYVADNNGLLVNTFGFCVPGTVAAGQACGAPGDVNPPYCNQGEVCAPFQTGPLCEPPCEPVPTDGGVTGCKSGDGCFSLVPLFSPSTGDPLPQVTGVCLPCTHAGDTTTGCQNSTECCDGFCAYDLDAGAGVCN